MASVTRLAQYLCGRISKAAVTAIAGRMTFCPGRVHADRLEGLTEMLDMSARGSGPVRFRFLLCLVFAPWLVSAAPPPLGDIPYWQMSQGCWLSENSYLDPEMTPNIPVYASLTCIELDGDRVIENETKFYPASKIASSYGGALLKDGEGVEVDNESISTAVGDDGTVRVTDMRAIFGSDDVKMTDPLTDDTALFTVRQPGDAVDLYRMIITMPTPDRRYILNLGLASRPSEGMESGDLRGFSIFRQRRIGIGEVAAWRTRMRKRFRIAVLVTAAEDGQLQRELITARD